MRKKPELKRSSVAQVAAEPYSMNFENEHFYYNRQLAHDKFSANFLLPRLILFYAQVRHLWPKSIFTNYYIPHTLFIFY